MEQSVRPAIIQSVTLVQKSGSSIATLSLSLPPETTKEAFEKPAAIQGPADRGPDPEPAEAESEVEDEEPEAVLLLSWMTTEDRWRIWSMSSS